MREGPDPSDAPRGEELAALALVLGAAAMARFVGLPGRGMWDSDQGHDMLVLLDWVRDGVTPLVGPPTSIGDLHHGALYYWLLAPAAFLSDADPLWVVATIALGGVAAVAVIWGFGRSVAGPVAGLVAAILVAGSAAAVEASTLIWNPSLIGLSSSVALGAAWQAWRSRRTGWWVAAAAGQAVTVQLHVLGATLVVPLVALFVADLRRRPTRSRAPLARAAAGAIAVVAVAYAPLLVHEFANGFPETRAIIDVLTGRASSTDAGPNPIVAVVVIAIRTLSWPVSGLLTDAPIVALAVAAAVVGILAWRGRSDDPRERTAARWLGGTLAWSILLLALVAPELATVTPGLPNDHYHAFLDPIVFVTAGMGAAALFRHRPVGRVLVPTAIALLAAWNVAIGPPVAAEDGGYPQAERAARRIVGQVPDDYVLVGLPDFKPVDAVAFPLARLGRPVPVLGPTGSTTPLVIVCDRLFRDAIGADCGGAAEAAAIAGVGGSWDVVDRFDLSARTSVTIYRPVP